MQDNAVDPINAISDRGRVAAFQSSCDVRCRQQPPCIYQRAFCAKAATAVGAAHGSDYRSVSFSECEELTFVHIVAYHDTFDGNGAEYRADHCREDCASARHTVAKSHARRIALPEVRSWTIVVP
jgi:hypothetical protein